MPPKARKRCWRRGCWTSWNWAALGCELPPLGWWHWTWVLQKNSKHPLTLQLALQSSKTSLNKKRLSRVTSAGPVRTCGDQDGVAQEWAVPVIGQCARYPEVWWSHQTHSTQEFCGGPWACRKQASVESHRWEKEDQHRGEFQRSEWASDGLLKPPES